MKKQKRCVTILLTAALTLTSTITTNSMWTAEYTSPTQINYYKTENQSKIGYSKLNNGDTYYAEQLNYYDGSIYKNDFNLSGSNILIRWYNKKDKKWCRATDLVSMPTEPHLYLIDTDLSSVILSIPTIYAYDKQHQTKVIKKEMPINIVKITNGYKISYELQVKENEVGEIWYMKSNEPNLVPDLDKHLEALSVHDLDGDKRWCFDGYYFKAEEEYQPYIKDMYYKHPSSYVGVSWTKYAECRGFKDLAYIMMITCVNNQSESGFWQTGSRVKWLYEDFQIPSNFYDTRFNTDFAEGLLYAYKEYGDETFKTSLDRYMEYYYKHATENNYQTETGGILVEDYAPAQKKTHSSLNHQLAELNLLYRYYDLTKKDNYLELASKMLRGIQDTKDYWVMKDGNLRYAYGYTGIANKMEDYPHLTYDDLYITKQLLKEKFNIEDDAIEFLMKNKLQWIKNNNIHGYYGENDNL